MAESVVAKLNALAERQGHPGSINVRDVAELMKEQKAQVTRLEDELGKMREKLGCFTRLEERIAALAAALRPFAALLEEYIKRSDYFEDSTVVYAVNWAEITVGDLFAARDAALSDAGKGWLPPEVREKVRKRLKRIASGRRLAAGANSYSAAPKTCQMTKAEMAQEARAALDALGGKARRD